MKLMGFIIILAWIAGAIGWVLNIIELVHSLTGPITAMFIARCVGVIIPFLGAVLGYL